MFALLGAAILATMAVGLTQRWRSTSTWSHRYIIDVVLELDARAVRSLGARPDTDVPGRLALGTSDPVDVTVRIKGQLGSKRSIHDKPALRISVLNGARVLGLENLTLNNMVQDPTMVREAIGYRVYADAGVPVPRTAYVRLAIGGEPRGLYLLVETIDRQFLADRFGDAGGILYEGAYGDDLRESDVHAFEHDEGDDPGRAELRRFVRAVANPGDDVFYGGEPLVDTDSFLAMMAVQVMIGDWDNYYKANNYRIYWHPSRRRWFFIPTGIDQTFATRPTVTAFGATGLLFRKCLESERCTAEYVDALRRSTQRFERMRLVEAMEDLLSLIDEASRADPSKPYTEAEMKAAREAMRRFIAERPQAVLASLAARMGNGD